MRKFFLLLGIFIAFSILVQLSFGGGGTSSVERVPTFTLDQAILTALQRNPTLLNAEQEIKRTRGVIIQVRAQVLPQVIFNGTRWPQIRGSFFQRDSAYFAFRNILDQLIATVKTQFYQIVVNRELVKVNEQSVHLLEAQLKDQQNPFEAGTVPRFNVLQAEVALYNQLPLLITAQNNLRISKIVLATTLGLHFQPGRGA